MTLLYFFNPITRAFIGSREAEVIPGIGIESPANATTKVPPADIPAQKVAVLDDKGKWKLLDDFRGDTWEKTTANKVQHTELGALPETLTTLEPMAMGRWNFDAGVWEMDPDQFRDSCIALVAVNYRQHLTAGFAHAGKIIQADEISQGKITGAVTMAMLAMQSAQPFSIDWTCADNSILTLDAASMCALGSACGAFVRECFYRQRTLKDALLAAATLEAINAINVGIGWPE